MRHAPSALVLLVCTAALATMPHRPERALDRLASDLAGDIAQHSPEPPVGVFVRGDTPELGLAFTTLLCAELGRKALPCLAVDAPGFDSAETAARKAEARSLVRVALSLGSGLLQARGDLLGTWVNFWSGTTRIRPQSPAGALVRSVEADPTVLGLLAAPTQTPAASAELRLVGAPFAHLPSWSAAIGAGDLDGDGRQEVVALTDEEVFAFSPDGTLLARREHRALPSSPTPCREPFGTVVVLGAPARLAYFSSKRTRGELLAFDRPSSAFRVLSSTEQAVLGAATFARLAPGQNVLWSHAPDAGTAPSWSGPAATVASFVTPGGEQHLLTVGSDTIGLWQRGAAGGPVQRFSGLGVGTTLADVDGDGQPELVTGAAAFAPERDELRVLPPAPPGTTATLAVAELPARFRTELPRGRLIQLSRADLDGDSQDELVAALWMPDGTTELVLFRRAP